MTTAILYGEEARLLPWACEVIGIEAFRPDAKTIGLERNGQVAAVVIFDNFSDVDCNMHIASDGSGRWMTKALLIHAFAYPFITCGLKRVTGMVPESNRQALAFDEHLGFVREGYHPDAADDGALITLGLLRKNCRFLPKQYRV